MFTTWRPKLASATVGLLGLLQAGAVHSQGSEHPQGRRINQFADRLVVMRVPTPATSAVSRLHHLVSVTHGLLRHDASRVKPLVEIQGNLPHANHPIEQSSVIAGSHGPAFVWNMLKAIDQQMADLLGQQQSRGGSLLMPPEVVCQSTVIHLPLNDVLQQVRGLAKKEPGSPRNLAVGAVYSPHEGQSLDSTVAAMAKGLPADDGFIVNGPIIASELIHRGHGWTIGEAKIIAFDPKTGVDMDPHAAGLQPAGILGERVWLRVEQGIQTETTVSAAAGWDMVVRDHAHDEFTDLRILPWISAEPLKLAGQPLRPGGS